MDTDARAARLRSVLKAKLGDIEPNLEAQAHTVWSRTFAGFTMDGLSLEAEPGISLPLLLLKPILAAGSQRPPVVLTFAQQGKDRFLSERSTELSGLLKRGVAVCLADVRGAGEIALDSGRGPGNMTLASVELMLGNTMLGAQLKDARTIVGYLSRRPDLDNKHVVLWGVSFAGVNQHQVPIDESPQVQVGPWIHEQAEPVGATLALLTTLYEDGVHAVAVRRGLASYLSVLGDRFCYVPLDAVVPGLLESVDIPDMVAALSPRAVLLEESVDGRNRLLDMPELATVMAPAYVAYRNSPSQLVIRQDTNLDLADWLARQCRGQ
jgi:hypothetical protein